MSDTSSYTSGWKALKKGDLIDLADKLGERVKGERVRARD